MKNIILVIFIFVINIPGGFSQINKYFFQLESYTEYSEAKSAIVMIREDLHVKAMHFLGDEDLFVIETSQNFTVIELFSALESMDFVVVGEIIKETTG